MRLSPVSRLHSLRRLLASAALGALPLAACRQDAPGPLLPDTNAVPSPAAVAMDGAAPTAPTVTLTDRFDGTCSTLPAVAFRFDDEAEGGPWTYRVDWGDGTASTGTAAVEGTVVVTRPAQYASQGGYPVVVTVTDADGLAGTSRTLLRFECNPPPVPGTLSFTQGTCTAPAAVAFDVEDNPADGPWSYTIAWGDGSAPTSGSLSVLPERVSATHAYAAPGTYAVTVTLTERRGPTTTITRSLVHGCNRPPVPAVVARSAGTCTTVPAFTFAVADEDGAADGPWSYEVTWGDGSAAATGTTALATNVLLSHAYAVSGTYPVTVKVTDGRGMTGTTTTELAFECSRPPTPIVSALATGTCTAAPALTFVVADLDGAADAPWAYQVDWGDGSPAQTGTVAAVDTDVRLQHAYAVSGSYTVTVRATDRRGLTGATTAKLTYDCNRPPAPTISATTDGTCSAMSAVTFSVADADGAGDGPWSYTIAWGDGSAATTGTAATLGAAITESHGYAVSGSYTATVTVTDRRGLAGTTSRALTHYCNRAPAVAVTARVAATCTAGAAVSFAVSDADGAGDGPWSWTIAWGDGTTSSGQATSLAMPVTAPHAYATNGSWQATITVTDRRGLSGSTAAALARSCLAASCAAGPGYWKNDESAYPYPYAATAPWLGGGGAAPTWDEVLGESKAGGNAYLQLASHWAAATLNRARGAPMSAAVLSVLDQAAAWLRAQQNADGSVPTLHDAQAEAWKDTLAAYNGGTLGTPACH